MFLLHYCSAAIAGVWFFRFSALFIILISIASCVGAEAIWQKLTKQKVTIMILVQQ